MRIVIDTNVLISGDLQAVIRWNHPILPSGLLPPNHKITHHPKSHY